LVYNTNLNAFCRRGQRNNFPEKQRIGLYDVSFNEIDPILISGEVRACPKNMTKKKITVINSI